MLAEALRGTGAEVISVDFSREMLRAAPGRAAVADALDLPFGDGSLDAVAAMGLLTYLPSLRSFLAEARRVLKPGGRILVSLTRRESPDTSLRAAFRVWSRWGVRGGARS